MKRRIVTWTDGEWSVLLRTAAHEGMDFGDWVRSVVRKAAIAAGYEDELVEALGGRRSRADKGVKAKPVKVDSKRVDHDEVELSFPKRDAIAQDEVLQRLVDLNAQDVATQKAAIKKDPFDAPVPPVVAVPVLEEDEFSPEAVKKRLLSAEGKANPF